LHKQGTITHNKQVKQTFSMYHCMFLPCRDLSSPVTLSGFPSYPLLSRRRMALEGRWLDHISSVRKCSTRKYYTEKRVMEIYREVFIFCWWNGLSFWWEHRRWRLWMLQLIERETWNLVSNLPHGCHLQMESS